MVFAQNMLWAFLFPLHKSLPGIHTYIQLPLKPWPYVPLPVDCVVRMKRKDEKIHSYFFPRGKSNIEVCTCIRFVTPVESILLATFTVLLHMSYWGFCAPITPAITGPWFNPMRKRNRWKLSRLIWSSTDIKASANSTTTVTLCSSVRRSSYEFNKLIK